MTTPLTKLQKEARALRMTAEEKSALHAVLMQKINSSHSVDAASPRSSPGLFYFFTPQLTAGFAAVLVVVLGVGTAYAAKSALPGEPLYAVKTKVAEPLAGALAFSTEDKIKFHTEVAQTRIEEAEVLASENRLDAATTHELEASIDTHLSVREELAAKLDEKKPGASQRVAQELNSSISAHGDVLAVLGSESSSSTTQENSSMLASKVRFAYSGATARSAKGFAPMAMSAQATNTSDAVSTTLSLATDTIEATTTLTTLSAPAPEAQEKSSDTKSKQNDRDSKDKRQALSLEVRATSTLASLTQKVQKVSDSVDKETNAKLSSRLSRISSLIAEGEAALAESDYERAKDMFNDALDREVTLSTFIEANSKFDNGILKSLLGNTAEKGDDEW